MKSSKLQVVPFLGLVVLAFFIAMSYVNNQIFLKEILVCGAIFGMVFFVKIRGEASSSYSRRRQKIIQMPLKSNVAVS